MFYLGEVLIVLLLIKFFVPFLTAVAVCLAFGTNAFWGGGMSDSGYHYTQNLINILYFSYSR